MLLSDSSLATLTPTLLCRREGWTARLTDTSMDTNTRAPTAREWREPDEMGSKDALLKYLSKHKQKCFNVKPLIKPRVLPRAYLNLFGHFNSIALVMTRSLGSE